MIVLLFIVTITFMSCVVHCVTCEINSFNVLVINWSIVQADGLMEASSGWGQEHLWCSLLACGGYWSHPHAGELEAVFAKAFNYRRWSGTTSRSQNSNGHKFVGASAVRSSWMVIVILIAWVCNLGDNTTISMALRPLPLQDPSLEVFGYGTHSGHINHNSPSPTS